MPRKIGVPVATLANMAVLKAEVLAAFPNAKLNTDPAIFNEDQLIDFLGDCDAAIIGLEPVTARVLQALPRLKVIAKFGVGTETIDFDAMVKYDVQFGYQYGVNRLSVAELTIAFAISALRGIPAVNLAMRAGQRPRANIGRLLSGRVFGIHGCGHIGKEVVRLLQPYGCKLIACDLRNDDAFYQNNGVEAVSFAELLARSEVLSLHLPLNGSTRAIYNEKTLALMRNDAVLINTCRGFVVDETALRHRLETGQLTAACFDVFAIEPAMDDRLLQLPNFLATPHIGAAAIESRISMTRAAIEGLSRYEPVVPGQFNAE